MNGFSFIWVSLPLERIKKETGILTAAAGMINDSKRAETILSKGQANLIMIAGASLRCPYFPLHAAKISGDDIDPVAQYARAKQ